MSIRVRGSTDDEVRQRITTVVAQQRALLTTLGQLEKVRTDSAASYDHNSFLGSNRFQDALRAIQSCQKQQKVLLAEATRVQALCPVEYPELLRLSVELMTTFSRVAAKPEEAESAPRSITDHPLRERSVSASI